jgi:flavin-dependent dehydrogenase
MPVQFLRLAATSALRLGNDAPESPDLGIKAKVDTKKFSADLLQAAEKMDADVRDVVRLLALKIENGAVVRTPVDTGRARASWNTSEEYADLNVQPEGQYAAYQEKTLAANPNPTGYLSGEKPIYITNNLEYIIDLEYGSSSQAPNGMARLAVADALSELNGIVQGR